jgi:hypothetical protein
MNIVGLAIGAGRAYVADASSRVGDRRVLGAAIGLVAAAAVYPLARRRAGIDWLEAAALMSASGLALSAVKRPGPRSRVLLGLGWIGHALFDATFRHDTTASRLPRWYPAFCAGFDLAYGAWLIGADATE